MIIDHSFHGLRVTTGQSYWVVFIWIFGVFSWLGNGYDGGFSPGRGKLSRPLKGTGEKVQEDASKSDNVFDLDQELCHGLCQAQS